MSVTAIKNVVENFLSSGENEFLMLRGGWGVGKTYFWRQTLENSSRNDSISKDYYSYVSLFGINNLQDLRNAIFASRANSRELHMPTHEKEIIQQVKHFIQPIEQIPFLKNWTGEIVNTALFLFVRDTIVCIDDVERRGKELEIKDMLGLLSLLKDQRNCKIVLIVNDGVFNTEEAEDFRKHSEKVADIELKFAPSLIEAFDCIFPQDEAYREITKEYCSRLNIRNIRTIQRIKRAIKITSPLMYNSDLEIIRRAIKILVLSVWCYYDKEKNAPPLSYLRTFSVSKIYIRDTYNRVEINAETAEWDNILKQYNYYRVDQFEKILINLAETGYLEIDAFKKEVVQLNRQAKLERNKVNYRDAWQILHSSFDDNQDEFISALFQSFSNSISSCSLQDLESTVHILYDLDRIDLGSKLVELYFEQHGDILARTRIDNLMLLSNLKNEYILHKIYQVQDDFIKEQGLAEIIRSINVNKNPSKAEIDYLAARDLEEYYDFFKSDNSESRYYHIQTCLQMEKYQITSSNAVTIKNKSTDALLKIAAESRFNRIRLERMSNLNLDLPPEDPNVSLLRKLLLRKHDT